MADIAETQILDALASVKDSASGTDIVGAGMVSGLRVDGGATQNDLLMQFQADLLGVPVVRPRVFETTALGAAYLAGLGVGFWNSLDELSNRTAGERIFEPRMTNDEAASLMAGWTRALDRARNWATAT